MKKTSATAIAIAAADVVVDATSAAATAAAVNKSSTKIGEVYFCEHHRKRNFCQIDSGRTYYNLPLLTQCTN